MRLTYLSNSNSLERDLCGSVDLLVVFGDRLDVGVPSVFSPHLLDSLLLVSQRWLSESTGPVLREISMRRGALFASDLVPLQVW